MTFLPNDDPRVLARVNAKRPNTNCSLFNHHAMTCDNCRDMVSIDYQGRNYFCAKEFVTQRFNNLMQATGRNIEIRWSLNYFTGKLADDNMEDGEGSGVILPPKIQPEGNTVGVDSPETERPEQPRIAEYETEDVVGEVFNG